MAGDGSQSAWSFLRAWEFDGDDPTGARWDPGPAQREQGQVLGSIWEIDSRNFWGKLKKGPLS